MGFPRLAVRVFPILLCVHVYQASTGNPTKFLLVSTPRGSKVSYMKLNSGTSFKGSASNGEMKTLIEFGVAHPQGIAYDVKKNVLLVTDPDSQMIFAYPLTATDTTLTAGSPKVFAVGTEARWVTVDGKGDTYFSDEPRNQIMKINYTQALVNATPEVVFDGTTMKQLSSPGGLAVDTFHTYWVNKQTGTQTGSLIQATQATSTAPLGEATALASNTDKSYGMCLGQTNIYYTQPSAIVYGIKKSGGQAGIITDKLLNPRGCAWDGDGTIYVADRGNNAVYSFPSNMPTPGPTLLTRVADYEDAFGVAIYAPSPVTAASGSAVSKGVGALSDFLSIPDSLFRSSQSGQAGWATWFFWSTR